MQRDNNVSKDNEQQVVLHRKQVRRLLAPLSTIVNAKAWMVLPQLKLAAQCSLLAISGTIVNVDTQEQFDLVITAKQLSRSHRTILNSDRNNKKLLAFLSRGNKFTTTRKLVALTSVPTMRWVSLTELVFFAEDAVIMLSVGKHNRASSSHARVAYHDWHKAQKATMRKIAMQTAEENGYDISTMHEIVPELLYGKVNCKVLVNGVSSRG